MNVLLYGEEKLLIEQKLKSLKKDYHIDDELSCMTYWYGETSFREIIEDAMTQSFFSENKMIIIKNLSFLTSQKAKHDEDDIAILFDYLKTDNPSTILVLYQDEHNFDERKKYVKQLRKLVKVFEIDKVNTAQLYKTTHQAFKARGVKIEDQALELLLSRLPESLLDISQEVEKLSLYSKHITVDDVNELVKKRIDENIFDLSKAILNGNTKQAMSVYKDCLLHNEEPIKLIVMCANSIRLLYQVKLMDRKGYNDQEIGRFIGVNPFRLKYIRQDGKNIEINDLLKALEDLAHLDKLIKTGKIDKYKGIELFILRTGDTWNH